MPEYSLDCLVIQSARAESTTNRLMASPRFFVAGEQVRELSQPLRATGELVIVQALSGG